MPIKRIIRGQHVESNKLERSRELRREMTPAEGTLWRELRGNKLGVRFRRQQVIDGFIVDFYCHQAGLVIEVDGGVHQGDEQVEDDAKRDKALGERGLRIVRFKNKEVVNNLPVVMEKIRGLISD